MHLSWNPHEVEVEARFRMLRFVSAGYSASTFRVYLRSKKINILNLSIKRVDTKSDLCGKFR